MTVPLIVAAILFTLEMALTMVLIRKGKGRGVEMVKVNGTISLEAEQVRFDLSKTMFVVIWVGVIPTRRDKHFWWYTVSVGRDYSISLAPKGDRFEENRFEAEKMAMASVMKYLKGVDHDGARSLYSMIEKAEAEVGQLALF